MRASFLILVFVFAVQAEEGMWTYNNLPLKELQQRYGFTPDAKWVEHVRLSTLRFGNGCSASFVSESGLILTNHHCARACIFNLSNAKSDYLENGFKADTPDAEKRCPGLEVWQLLSIADVTERVNGATAGKTEAEFTPAENAVKAAITKECATSDAFRCDVVTLYSGARHDLYKYRRYTDIRMVFAPENKIAFFGGDPDNFMFPRYDLDVSFLRAYEGGAPVRTPHFLKWSKDGPKEGALTFMAGNPGSTNREYTLAELDYERDIVLPDRVATLSELRGMLAQFQTKGPEQKRISETELFSVENSLKVFRNSHRALAGKQSRIRKSADEQMLLQRITADPGLARQYGSVLGDIEKSIAKRRALRDPMNYIEGNQGFRSQLYGLAKSLVRAAAELPKPGSERLPEFSDARLPALRARLFSTAPIYPELEIETLALSLTKLREVLGPDDPFVRAVLGKKAPREVAEEAVKGSKLADVSLRKSLFEGGAPRLAGENDPMIQLAKLVDPHARAIRKRYETGVEAEVKKNGERLGRARFAIFGTSIYPDATGSPRLSYGAVKGWNEDGKPVPAFTVLGGAFERQTGRDPFKLPDSWLKNQQKLRLSTPFNFVSTNDITGGNSGSPVFDRKAELVGIVFDGNIHSLGGDYWFDESLNRAVSVDSRAILETLKNVYSAERLLKELSQ